MKNENEYLSVGHKGERGTTQVDKTINMIFVWNRLEDSGFDHQGWSPCSYITQGEFSAGRLAPPSSEKDPRGGHSDTHGQSETFKIPWCRSSLEPKRGPTLLSSLCPISRLFFFSMHLNLDVAGPWPSCHPTTNPILLEPSTSHPSTNTSPFLLSLSRPHVPRQVSTMCARYFDVTCKPAFSSFFISPLYLWMANERTKRELSNLRSYLCLFDHP